MDHLPPQEFFRQSEVVFHAIELAAREVTGCTPHIRKPSSAEKKFCLLLNTDRNAPDFPQKCETLVNELHEARTVRANKRVHASLVSGRGMKKALAAHSKVSTPPIALINEDKQMSNSPQDSCSIMSKTLSQLGGEMEYVVPASVEAEFLREVPNKPPLQKFGPPHLGSVSIHYSAPQATESSGA